MIIDSQGWVSEVEQWGNITGDNSSEAFSLKKIDNKPGSKYKLPDLIEMMDEMGVDKTVILGANIPVFEAKIPNKFIADNVEQSQDRLIGIGSVHDVDGLKAVREIDEIHSLGLPGVRLSVESSNAYPWDKRIWPIYEKCQDLDLIIYFHTGWSGSVEINGRIHGIWKNQRVEHLDEVCVEFPKLRVVANYAGVSEWKTCLMLMLKNKNLWANTDGLAAGYIPPEDYILMIKNAKALGILNKLMWGTDNVDQRLDLPLARSLPELAKKHNIGPTMPDITQEDMDGFLGNNAARLFDIKI